MIRGLRCLALVAVGCTLPIGLYAQATPGQVGDSASGRRLTLQEALSLADRQNLDIAAARLKKMVSLAGITIAGERPNPTVSFGATRDTPHESLFFDLPVELGGKRSTRIEQARQEVSLTDIEISTVSRQVRHDVRNAFFAAALGASTVHQQQKLVDLATRLRDIAKSRFDAGDVPQLEVMQADLELSRAQADLEVARQEARVAFGKLAALLNEPAGTTWELVTPLDSMPEQVGLQDLVSRATAANPELQHLAQELKVEQAREKVFRAERVPDVTLEGGADFNSPPDFQVGARGQVTVGVPVFTRMQGELAQSAATQKLIEGETLATQRSVAGDVETAFNEFNARLTEVRLYRDTVIPAGRKLEDLAEQSYSAGKTSILAVLDAQRNVQQNERDYLQSLYELQQAFAELEQIVGVPLD
ncbi:MAG TPA: TolC family protein [Candidatus Acidoferrum sp.]|nr:TolC family protein [Candidatus Acidoferrum sp.]